MQPKCIVDIMAINKNALLRYQTIDKCLSNTGRGYTFDELLNEVNNALLKDNPENTGIEIRQLREDIRNMKKESIYGAPITSKPSGNGRKHFYFYEDPKFSINNRPLNDTEMNQLDSLLNLFDRFENIQGLEWTSEMGVKLKHSFKNNNSQKVIRFDNVGEYEGYKFITPIFNSIINKRVIKVNYKPFDKEEFQFYFHPYYLKQFNNRWFVFGNNTDLKINNFNLALDRIVKIHETDEKYINSSTDWEEYFDEIVGVTKFSDAKIEEIKLQFSAEQAPYVLTKPLHPYQINKKNEKGLLVTLKLIPNYELEQLILSFGEKVEVLSPLTFRDKIQKRILNLKKVYD